MTDYYKEEDSNWFFERQEDTKKIIQILKNTDDLIRPLFDSSEVSHELRKLIRMKKGDLYVENNTTRI